ncbi:D-alanine--D-alanine ligase family protein [Persephonella hydrogeniphila]|uniref:D-alanine--D-alanine ligase family protein n=1 Tax=Persephonella hydrogeniphila TaxID=198703 RepID=UPI000BE358BE|nr:D-alanine--D-alanine ligase [Persephonella hydrogeniphila]
MSDLKIALVYGGKSSEREISIKSGNAVKEALKRLNLKFEVFDPVDSIDFVNRLIEYKPDLVFNVLHGKYGEDGSIQGLFEILGYRYTGSPVKASAIAMDKVLSKEIAQITGIPTPDWIVVENIKETEKWNVFPAVVKPNEEGSSIGVEIVNGREELCKAVENASKLNRQVIIEEFINGREITIGILNGRPLEPIEIVVEDGFYDFENKYISGKTEYIVSPYLVQEEREKLESYSLKIYNKIGCKGAARIDFILKDGTPYFLEINTIPGMTDHSLLPKAAKAVGIDFDNLVLEIIRGALDG